jgi:hypothetical protein
MHGISCATCPRNPEPVSPNQPLAGDLTGVPTIPSPAERRSRAGDRRSSRRPSAAACGTIRSRPPGTLAPTVFGKRHHARCMRALRLRNTPLALPFLLFRLSQRGSLKGRRRGSSRGGFYRDRTWQSYGSKTIGLLSHFLDFLTLTSHHGRPKQNDQSRCGEYVRRSDAAEACGE